MKQILLFLSLISLPSLAQEHYCAKNKQASAKAMVLHQAKMAALSSQTSHDFKYDVKFVHLDLQLERNTKYIVGHAKTVATVTSAVLDTFMTTLHLNHSIDSIRFNGALYNAIRQDSAVKVGLPSPLSQGASFTVSVYYKGTAPTGGAAIGSGYNMGTSGAWQNQATWSLSESFVAYHWWPSKQILTDKIDSSWVYITTDSTNMAGSNGLLKNVVTIGNKKRFEWQSRKPIAYYLISTAVAKYKEYNQYAKPQYLANDSILIQNFIYDNAINNQTFITGQKLVLDELPDQMNFFCDIFGMYPYYDEKYGNCMAPFSGGMEHQTMSTVGFFDYYINAHELAHQWWGDHVTCKTWADIWINEGFASYSEHLAAEYLKPGELTGSILGAHNSVMQLPGGRIHIPVQDTMNTARIFSSRLTYDKGGAILHTLRFVTNNDSVWFNTLRNFQSTYAHSTAASADFINFYQVQTGINPTQFFNQWYYGEGYPSFNVRYNYDGTTFWLRSSQTVSMPNVTPLFITPIEYRISRVGKADTTIRLQHSQTVENYTLALTGTVSAIVCDPNNWLINKASGLSRDLTLGTDLTGLVTPSFESIGIGPNPTDGLVTLSNPASLQGQIEVYAINGQMLLQQALQTITGIDFTTYPQGVYILRVKDSEGKEQFNHKIIRN